MSVPRICQPAGLTVVAPNDTDPRGVTSDPNITLPWNLGRWTTPLSRTG
ncbi:hypothetical protein [Kutzneria kofuensis]